jgi:hypothetical protein
MACIEFPEQGIPAGRLEFLYEIAIHVFMVPHHGRDDFPCGGITNVIEQHAKGWVETILINCARKEINRGTDFISLL